MREIEGGDGSGLVGELHVMSCSIRLPEAIRPESTDQRVPEWGCVMREATKSESVEVPRAKNFQNAGGDDGTRTRGLMRDRHAF